MISCEDRDSDIRDRIGVLMKYFHTFILAFLDFFHCLGDIILGHSGCSVLATWFS